MVSNFWDDLRIARKAEDIVRDTFAALTNAYTFIDVGSQKEYFHKGDIKAVAADGREIMIEVKNDGRIADTHNLLCEESNYYYATGETIKGNFYSDYQIYCVVSQAERKIYVMDFSKLKAHYKSGRYKEVYHLEQISSFYLCPLEEVRQWGAMIAEIDY